MALSRRTAAITSLLAFMSVLGACDGFKKTKDACSVTIAPPDIQIPVNGTITLAATAFDCDGNSIANKKINYSSSDAAVVSVSPLGQILGIKTGTAKVSAVANGKTGTANVTVTPERVQTITVDPATWTLRRNQTKQFTATAKNSQGNVITGISFQWASSNSSLASVSTNGLVTSIAPGAVTITATADGQVGSSLLTLTEVPIGSCTLTPANQKVTVSNQVQPTLALRDTAGNVLSTTGRVMNWASDNDLVATVSGTGVVTARKAGTAKITASDQANSAINCNTNVEVVDARIVSAKITPVGAIVRIGAPRQYAVQLLDSNNVAIPQAGRTVTWKNLSPAFATVTTGGVVSGIAVTSGAQGRLAVDAEGAVDTVTFTVTKIPVQTVSVNPAQRTVTEGQTAQFAAVVTDSAGNIVTDRTIDWLSSDNLKATVNSSGLVTTLAPGTVTITAVSALENRSGNAQLTITQIPVDTILLTQTQLSMTKNTNSAFSIQLKDAAGRELRNRQVVVTSDQPSVAVGTANATSTQVSVTGLVPGTATLTIQAVNSNNQNEGKPSKIVVTVIP